MKMLDDLISALKVDAPVRDIRVCAFWTAVVSRYCGLAATVQAEGFHHGDKPVQEAGSLMGKSALAIARLSYSPSPLEASIGLATINSLLDVDESRCVDLNAADFLAEKGRDRAVAIVGHFPFIPRLRQMARQLWVIEKHPQEGDLTEDQATNILPKADVVAITGTTLINHTIEPLLALCHPEALVVLLGPTTPLSPVLFDYGVDVLSGTRVIDVELALRCISEGATFRQVRGVKLLTMTRNDL
ncbi:MAG: DUF364 domain-containing protein [Chloroflexi bacterium]|nr:DUF364 domain-containing protein [Chloroflexota bacterium]MCL5076351.1 DUF364 domain-containing protein [Chloroflexota bacterium]